MPDQLTSRHGGAGTSRLWIVDSDAAAAHALADLARETGFEPTHLPGLELLLAHETELDEHGVVCVALHLDAGTDGVHVLRRLGAQACRASVLLVGALDRRVLDAARRLAVAHGLHVLGTLPKPIDPERLRHLLRTFAPARAPAPAGAPAASVSAGELQRGLDADEVEVYFQPKIVVDTLAFSGVEALVRWSPRIHGHLAADAFVGLAERSGLIGQLTRRVMGVAFAAAAAWEATGIPVRMAINLSPRSLSELALPDLIEALAQQHGLAPARIVVEITEGWREEDEISALDVLTRLRLKGFALSIDDFGTGYSSMLQLKRMPFSELKLSGSFIHGAAADREARAILEASVNLGRELGLHVVAEGIERQEDWNLVTELGCDEAQGYFVSRPLHADALPYWLGRWNRLLGR